MPIKPIVTLGDALVEIMRPGLDQALEMSVGKDRAAGVALVMYRSDGSRPVLLSGLLHDIQHQVPAGFQLFGGHDLGL